MQSDSSSLYFMCNDKKKSNFYIAQLGTTLMGEQKIFQNVCDWHTVNESPEKSVPNWNIIFIDSDGDINKRKEGAKAKAKEEQQRQRQDKNNGTKDIFISIILIMTPESKQKAGRVTYTPHPEAETGAVVEGEGKASRCGRPPPAAHNKTKVLISSRKLCNVKLMRR